MRVLDARATADRISAPAFRNALRRHAAGVVIVTGAGPDGPVGFTATSFVAASLDPPLVSFYVDQASHTGAILRASRHFAVNLMASGQREVANLFSRRDADRFAAVGWHEGPGGLPFLDGALAGLACGTETTARVGDHYLVVGVVLQATVGSGAPLVYHDARYGSFHPQ